MILMDLARSYIYVLWEHNTKSDIDSQIFYSTFVRTDGHGLPTWCTKRFLMMIECKRCPKNKKILVLMRICASTSGRHNLYFKPVQGYEKGNALQIFVTSLRIPKVTQIFGNSVR